MNRPFLILAILAVLMLGNSAPTAHAQQSHGIDFTQTLTGLDGKPMQNGDAKPVEPLTLSSAAVNALESQTPDDARMPGEQKFKLDQLAHKVYQAKDASLTTEEIATIKDRIAKVYGPLVVGACWRLLDPAQK